MNNDQSTQHPGHWSAVTRAALRGYAVVVYGPAVRTRVYTTLAGAENAVARATERGSSAQMCLVRLVPTPNGRLA